MRPYGGIRGKVKGSPKSLRYITWEPGISVQNVVPIHLADVEISHCINENADMLVVIGEMSRGH